jgi:cation diffusion facilitator CzcD-associated flavoprotein CzcO
MPYWPEVPGKSEFRGEAYHTGLWPHTPVDFGGKRVAIIGTGASGVQLIPAIADQVASLTVYQRTPNWVVPLNNRPITDDEQAEMRANFESIRATLLTSLAGFLHRPHDRKTFEDNEEDREFFYETMWRAPGFATLGSNYTDLMTDREANAEFCKFMASKIRSIVKDPATAEQLIPKDHPYGGKRPPFATGYYEAYNDPRVSLVDLKETPIERVTESGIETTEGARDFDIIVWATGFDFGTGAMLRMGIRGFHGRRLNDHWADGPRTFLGIQTSGFPNLFFAGGPHGAGGNNPRYGGDQVEYIVAALRIMRERGYRSVDVPSSYEEAWTSAMDDIAAASLLVDGSYFLGGNIPGKPRRLLYNLGGKPKMMEMMNDVLENDFAGFMD